MMVERLYNQSMDCYCVGPFFPLFVKCSVGRWGLGDGSILIFGGLVGGH